MNQEIRRFLIDQCVAGKPIYYEVIGKMMGLDLQLESERIILSKTLGEISTFEYQNERPLISSIAIYKQKNDHGYGFYNLCQELGIGKSSTLSDNLYGFTQIEECKIYWQKEENYLAFYNLTQQNKPHQLDFFNAKEIEFLSNWADQVYDKDNEEHIAAKNYIMNSVGTKTQYWSNQIVQSVPGLNTFNWRMWSQKGWTDTDKGKIRIARFKHYTWARIYRVGDNKKNIFFTVGVDGKSKQLIYKLDYFFEKNSNLSPAQKVTVNSNIPSELRSKSISLSELQNLDWESLIKLTSDFISENLYIYDRLIALAWGDSDPDEVFTDFLRLQDFPSNGITTLPVVNPNFNGIEKDYIQEAIENKELGDAGEELVKQYEINRLNNLGFKDLAEKVDIMIDGKGYDILSFDQNRKPKYIEVKTTSGNSLTPFFYSINERLFAERNKDRYFIYRLYNYDEEKNIADFYIINNLNENVLMQPISFKVYLKKN